MHSLFETRSHCSSRSPSFSIENHPRPRSRAYPHLSIHADERLRKPHNSEHNLNECPVGFCVAALKPTLSRRRHITTCTRGSLSTQLFDARVAQSVILLSQASYY